MKKRSRIAVVGSMLNDFTAIADRLPRPGETIIGHRFTAMTGGKGANQAVQAARLGAEVIMVGRLGNDKFGENVTDALTACGVTTSHIHIDPEHGTGACCIHVGSGGENTIVIYPGANSWVSEDDVNRAWDDIRSCDIMLLQLEIPIPVVTYAACRAKKAGVRVILNPAPAPTVNLPPELIKAADFLTPNETETEIMTGIPFDVSHIARWEKEAAAALMGAGTSNVIITLGSNGAYVCAGECTKHIPAFGNIKTVDSTGAGDAFNGALAYAFTLGKPLESSLLFASAAGALSTQKAGARDSMCTLAEIESFLRERNVD